MNHLLLVGHDSFACGLAGAVGMLLGERPYLAACCLEEGMDPHAFERAVDACCATMGPSDTVVVLADIAGGLPARTALACCARHGVGEGLVGMGGANLPMAVCAVMGLDDGMDAASIRDALLADGAGAIRELEA